MRLLVDISSLTRDQQGWVALAVAVMCIGYLLFRPKLKKRKDPLEKTPFSSLSRQRSVERQMQNLLVELSDMTRQMNAQIETRAAKLQELMRQADERIAELRRLQGEPPDIGESSQTHVEPEAPAPKPVIPVHDPTLIDIDPRHAEIYTMADQGRDAREIAAKLNRPSGEVELILALRPRG
jgi:hypothetical protein